MVEEGRIGGKSVGESRLKGGESCIGLLTKKGGAVKSGWDVVVMDVSGHGGCVGVEWGGIDFLVRVCMSVGCSVGVGSAL